jgi:hypothetical protein
MLKTVLKSGLSRSRRKSGLEYAMKNKIYNGLEKLAWFSARILPV